MIEQVLGLVAAASALLALILVVIGFRARNRPRRFCAGEGRGWRAFVSPWRWVWNPVCAYDLTGLSPGPDGLTRCPECGARAGCGRRARRPSALRPFGCAAVATIFSAGTVLVARDRAGSWVGAFPTVALVVLERELPTRYSRAARRVLDLRMARSQLMDVEARVLSEHLIADLRADRRSMNATRAQERLAALWPHSERALESALGSPERQVRFLASQVLRRKLAMPTESLLRAAVEDLADDGGGLLAGYLSMGNAWEAAAYLRRFPDLARPLLVDIIRTGDWQQRFIGAAIMAQCEMSDLARLAAPILIEHLGDNDIEGDASLAAPLLLSLGEPIADLLESHRHDADAQRRQLCRAILARLGRPTDPAHPELDRPPRVTGRMIDPLDRVVR